MRAAGSEVKDKRTGDQRAVGPRPNTQREPAWRDEEGLANMADAVCQGADEVLDSSCDGVSISADLSDVVQHGCKTTHLSVFNNYTKHAEFYFIT